MRFFKSDNTAAVSREILQAITDANAGPALAYGADRWSDALDRVFGEFFGTEVRVFAVSSGTAANSLALATFCPPWGTVLTHAEAHIERDECGAPEFFTGGAKLSLIGGAGAKIAAGRSGRAARLVRAARAWRAAAHAVDHPGDRTRRDLHAAGNQCARENCS